MLAVLGDRPPGDVDAFLLQELDEPLITVRMSLVLEVDELLDALLDGLAGEVVAGGTADAGVEEILELEDSLRGVDVFVGRDPRDRRLVHLDVLGDILEDQRPQVLPGPRSKNPRWNLRMLRVTLTIGALALLDRADEPLRRAHALVDVLLRLGVLPTASL